MVEPLCKPTDEPNDGRNCGEWESRYPAAAWRHILLELSFLIVLLLLASGLLVAIGVCLTTDRKVNPVSFLGYMLDRQLLKWIAVALSGLLGGVAFDLKWLYHSVARGLWSQDRCLWRIIVPFISGIVSVFLAFMIVSGIIPFIKGDSFNSLYFSLGFGFLFGYFSDSVLAALKKFADGAFGRTDASESK